MLLALLSMAEYSEEQNRHGPCFQGGYIIVKIGTHTHNETRITANSGNYYKFSDVMKSEGRARGLNFTSSDQRSLSGVAASELRRRKKKKSQPLKETCRGKHMQGP